MLGLGLLTNPDRKGPFFSTNQTLNRKGVTQITVRPLIKGSGEANPGLNRYYPATPGYLATFRKIS
jgi:hypothetical protein